MNLIELFNQPVEIRWEEVGVDYGSADFTINGKDYTISFTFYDSDNELPNRYSIEFGLLPDRKKDQSGLPKWHITNSGDQFQVFSAVIRACKEWLIDNPVPCIVMSAAEPSRKKLYLALLRKLLPSWNIRLDGHVIIALDDKARLS